MMSFKILLRYLVWAFIGFVVAFIIAAKGIFYDLGIEFILVCLFGTLVGVGIASLFHFFDRYEKPLSREWKWWEIRRWIGWIYIFTWPLWMLFWVRLIDEEGAKTGANLWLASFLFLQLSRAFFRCPRCRKRFGIKGWRVKPWGRECLHCHVHVGDAIG